jgi:hypothetical protein
VIACEKRREGRKGMVPENSRIESGHVLLNFSLADSNGRLQVECRRSTDFFLEMLLVVAIGFPFLLGGIGMLGKSLYGSSDRSFYGAAAVFLFLIAVALLTRGMALLRDGFRRLIFSAEDGLITVIGCSLSSLLGRSESLRFNDVASFRINSFEFRRLPFRSPEQAFEIVMILKTGDAITVFPYFSTRETAEEALQKLTGYTGISSY